MKQLLKDLQEEVSDSTTIYYDNLSSIQLAKNPVFHAQTKHIEVHYHFVCVEITSSTSAESAEEAEDRRLKKPSTESVGTDR